MSLSLGSLTPSSAVTVRPFSQAPLAAAARQSACCFDEFVFAASANSSTGEGMPPLGAAFPASRSLAHLARHTAGPAGNASSSSNIESLQHWSSSSNSKFLASKTSRSSCTKVSVCSMQIGAANLAIQPGTFHSAHDLTDASHVRRRSSAVAAAGAQHYSTEDAEVAAVTLSGRRQQLGPPLVHHIEAIFGHLQQRSSCRSTPPVLPAVSSSSSCCTPAPGRRSCSALELAAMAEGYIQPALSRSAAAAADQPPANRRLSALVNTSSLNSSQQQHSEQVYMQHAANSNVQQHAVSTVQLLLPPRQQISSKDMKQRLLVEPPGSPQLLPHTQGRSATLLSALQDSSGALDLDPETPKLLSPAAQAPSSYTAQASSATAGIGLSVGPGAARLAAIEALETCTGYESGHADAFGEATDMHKRSPLVVVLPPVGNEPSSHGTERWRAASNEPPIAAARAAAAALDLGQSSTARANPVGTGSDRGRSVHDGMGRLRGTQAENPGSPNTAAMTAAGGAGLLRNLQQQRSHSSSHTNSRGAAASSRNCSSSCDMHGNVLGQLAVPASSRADSSRGSVSGVRSSSGAGGGRGREPAGPLELDPCAPPLGSSKLSQPELADVDYIVHRWSHRWQWDRQHQAATAANPTTAPAAGKPLARTAEMPSAAAAAAAAAASAEWVRSPEQLHLFGTSAGSAPKGVAARTRPAQL